MSPLSRWCHRHRLAVVLGWVALLLGLAGALAAAGTNFGDSQTAQNSESATASALLQHASVGASGNSGYIVWQTPHGTVTASSAEPEMSGLLGKIAQEPGVASVTSPYTSAGSAQISSDHTIAYANVQFDRTATKTQQQAVQSLAPRELEVLRLIAAGLSNQEIAERLFVTQATAKTHANHAMAKLGARDRAQLVVIAYETGLVQPGTRTAPS